MSSLSYKLNTALESQVKETLNEWRQHKKVQHLWSGDQGLWTNNDENRWLGWLNIVSEQLSHLQELKTLANEIRNEGFTNAVLLGMGGSSLGPEVLSLTVDHNSNYPPLQVLDSTVPAQIKSVETTIDLKNTIFIVSSKSGATLEPNILEKYFFNRVQSVFQTEARARRFIAITDPGSKTEDTRARCPLSLYFSW